MGKTRSATQRELAETDANSTYKPPKKRSKSKHEQLDERNTASGETKTESKKSLKSTVSKENKKANSKEKTLSKKKEKKSLMPKGTDLYTETDLRVRHQNIIPDEIQDISESPDRASHSFKQYKHFDAFLEKLDTSGFQSARELKPTGAGIPRSSTSMLHHLQANCYGFKTRVQLQQVGYSYFIICDG